MTTRGQHALSLLLEFGGLLGLGVALGYASAPGSPTPRYNANSTSTRVAYPHRC